MEDLNKIIQEMKSLADSLIDYSFPKATFEEEQQILCLKQREFTIDGYDLSVCYSRADYDKYFLENLQIQSQQVPFLPFTVVCKVGKLFLGEKNICYLDFFRNNRKVYCWTIRTHEENILVPDKTSKPFSYEGFDFHILHPGTVDLL